MCMQNVHVFSMDLFKTLLMALGSYCFRKATETLRGGKKIREKISEYTAMDSMPVDRCAGLKHIILNLQHLAN